ncbi:MAG: carbon storage regulator CsrA [Nitrospiraceae bacterium]|nr:carbon storage regulator CsrA [Nitrospiraceae bacterium]MDA8090881.1 carbon storage regulator CsrA [Nitrospiraceae bacterium]
MLVLTRKSGEAIRIGEDITVSVVEVREGHVRLGINAPQGIRIYREEVYERIVKDNMVSSSISIDEFSKIKEAVKGEDKI